MRHVYTRVAPNVDVSDWPSPFRCPSFFYFRYIAACRTRPKIRNVEMIAAPIYIAHTGAEQERWAGWGLPHLPCAPSW